MSSHSKCSVLVVSSAGTAYTTKRGARRLISNRMAFKQPDGSLLMDESDHRYACVTPTAAAPTLAMKSGHRHKEVDPTACGDCHRVWIPDGTWETCEALRRAA